MAESILWSSFNQVQKINLSHKTLDHLPRDVLQWEQAESLNLENNSLISLPKEFGTLKQLKVLNLSHNNLRKVPDCVFKLQGLVEMNVNHNMIEITQEHLGNFCDLIWLDISHNKLLTLTPGVGFLNRLKHINLSNNHLQSIPHELTSLCGLEEVNISFNEVKKLPCMRNLLHLKVFTAHNNLLKEIPDLSQCQELVSLDISHNLIEDIESASLNCQPFMRDLYLQNNKIKHLPDEIINLSSLAIIDISFNMLDTLPLNIIHFPNLRTLKIGNNPLKDIPVHYAKADTPRLLSYLHARENELPAKSCDENQLPSAELTLCDFSVSQLRKCGGLIYTNKPEQVSNCVWDNAVAAKVMIANLSHCRHPLSERVVELAESLRELHLVDSGLTQLPACICQLHELQVLTLDHNEMSDIPPELAACTYLYHLSLSYNRFDKIPEVVYRMTSLHILDISNNHLSDISSASVNLSNLPYLETLNLSNNNISYLPPTLGLLKQLRSLLLTGNKFRQPGHQILSKGTEALLSYLANKIPIEADEEVSNTNKPPLTTSYFIQ